MVQYFEVWKVADRFNSPGIYRVLEGAQWFLWSIYAKIVDVIGKFPEFTCHPSISTSGGHSVESADAEPPSDVKAPMRVALAALPVDGRRFAETCRPLGKIDNLA